MYGETSNIVAEKFAAAQKHGLTPILCVGESGPAREARRTFEVLAEELDVVIEKNGTMLLIMRSSPMNPLGCRDRKERNTGAGTRSSRVYTQSPL